MLKESDTGGYYGLATLSLSYYHRIPTAFTPSWKTDAGALND
ncbi:hypothetical protein AB1287_02710 [Enterobacter asburiae]|nr:hypothetical protein [Scandinavium sp.]